MTEEQEVVIVGKDGKEHVFPQGFDPKKAAGIVAQQLPSEPESAKPSNTLKMRKNVFTDDYDPIGLFPRDTQTGERLTTPAPKVPRGTLPVLAGMAAAAGTAGLSVPLQAAIAGLAGAAGEGGEEALRGERMDPARMAGAGLTQAATSAVPMVAKPVGNAAAKVGSKLAGFAPGTLSKLAIGAMAAGASSALPFGLEYPVGAAAAKWATPAVKSGVQAGGRGVARVGEALADAATRKTSGEVIGQMFGKPMRATAGRVPMLPDALRKMQLLYRVITGRNDQQ